MRHHNTKRKFGRTKNQREALMRSLVRNLILRERIKTTLPKAKELKSVVEKFVTKAKTDTPANRRIVQARLASTGKETKKLFDVISKKYVGRKGGYTRVLKLGARKADSAPMALIEFI